MQLHSFTVHILLAVYPIMVTVGGDIRPDWRQLPKSLLLAAALAVPVYGANLLLGTNFMFLMRADEGNPLLLFEKLWGNHLLGLPVLAAGVFTVMYGILYVCRKVRARKQSV